MMLKEIRRDAGIAALSALLAAPMVSCYASSSQAMRNDPIAHVQNTLPVAKDEPRLLPQRLKQEDGCRFVDWDVFEYKQQDGSVRQTTNMLEFGEIPLQTSCNPHNAFILTDRAMLVVPGGSESDGSIELNHVRIDVEKIYKAGFVSWAAAEDRCFFLTRDNRITEIPVIIKDGTVPVHIIPYDMKKAAMAYHSGLLFIAPVEGKMIVAKIDTSIRYVEINLPDRVKDGRFQHKNGMLHFGSPGNSLEIRTGMNPGDTELLEK